MKKAAFLLLTLLTVFVLAACSTGNPTDVVKKYMDASAKVNGSEGDKYTCKNTSKEFADIKTIEITNLVITKEKESGSKAEVRATGHMKATMKDGTPGTDSDFNLLFKLKKSGFQWCIDDMEQN